MFLSQDQMFWSLSVDKSSLNRELTEKIMEFFECYVPGVRNKKFEKQAQNVLKNVQLI